MIDLSGRDTRSIMTMVALCLAPGLLLQGLLLDIIGVALNVLAAVTAGVLTERGCEALRGRAVPRHYSALDATTLVTCLIIAAALPPGAWAFAALAAALGVGLGRQAYGGLGNNLF
ncbi:MAG: RnfABCDGE type electron transport complex subunit D, partial [Pseudomonadota bacterium]